MLIFRLSVYMLGAFIVLSCSCVDKDSTLLYHLPHKPPADKNLKEVVLLGKYRPKDIEDEIKRRQKKYENCVWYWKGMGHSNKKAMRYCEDELTKKEDELKTKDSFLYSGINYCYTEVKDKHPVYDKKLVARLYDRQGKILAEDYVRCSIYFGINDCDKQDNPSIRVYLPYHDSAKELHIVSLKEKKEFIVYKDDLLSQSILTDYIFYILDYSQSVSADTDSPPRKHPYRYNPKTECFTHEGDVLN